MLQVTFRNLLPDEGLVMLASQAYRALTDNTEESSAGLPMACHIAVVRAPQTHPVGYLVQLELLRGPQTCLCTKHRSEHPREAMDRCLNVVRKVMRLPRELPRKARENSSSAPRVGCA